MPIKKIRFLFLPLVYALLLFACSNGVTHHNYIAYGYGTIWDVHLYEGTSQECEQLARDINESSRYFDVTETGMIEGGLNKLNQTNDYVTLDPMVIEALRKAEAIRVETEGAYDYRLGDLVDAWLSCLEEGKLLDESTRISLLEKALATSVAINGNQAKRNGEGKIDLGGLAKGYCCQKLKETLDSKGYSKYLVNGGTSSLLIGEKGSGDGTVRVIMSDAEEETSFHAKNASVSCSSVNRQHYEIGGITYSHIIDPCSGLALSKYRAVYLLGDDPCALDAYSTAAMVRDLDFAEFLEGKGIKAAYVKDGSVIYASEGFLD